MNKIVDIIDKVLKWIYRAFILVFVVYLFRRKAPITQDKTIIEQADKDEAEKAQNLIDRIEN